MNDINQIKIKVTPLLKKYNIKKASLFGSIVKGNFTKKSDIDMLVEIPENYSLFDFIHIKTEIEEKLGKTVDLIQYKSIKPFVKKEIMSHQIPIYNYQQI